MNQKDQHFLAKNTLDRKNIPDLLYHFTTLSHYNIIEREGITHGVIPRSMTNYIKNRQWLTANPDWYPPWAAGLSGSFTRTQVRITVKVENYKNLVHWPQYSIKYVPQSMIKMLNSEDNPSDWYIYCGKIPVRWFIKVDYRQELDQPIASIDNG